MIFEPLPKSIVALAAQAFFTWRKWIFSGHRWIFPIILTPLLLWQTVGSILYIVLGSRAENSAELMEGKIAAITYGINAVAAVVDIFIADFMCVLLYRKRSGLKP